jgi:nucleotide-binding universal stress UspA family protein
MHIRNILVAWDGSKPSERALAFAEDLAGEYAARLVLVTVLQPLPVGPGAFVPVDPFPTQKDIDESKQELEGCAKELRARGRNVEVRVQVGETVRTLQELADRFEASVIVAGRSGKGSIARAVLGSVTTALLHNATRPILVVP